MTEQDFISALTKANKKSELLSLLIRYGKFPTDRKQRLKTILAKTEDGRFYVRFLDRAGGNAGDRRKACAWLLARKTFGLPYDGERVRKLIETEDNLEDLRNAVFQAIADTYREPDDRDTCRRISLRARTEKKRIVCGRFSRAFYVDALLLANAKLVPAARLAVFLGALKARAATLPFNPSYLAGEIQRLETGVLESEIPVAQIAGGLARLKDGLLDYESKLLGEFDKGRPRTEYAGARRTIEQLRTAIRDFERRLAALPGRSPVYMVFFQRIFPIDAIYMGLLNELAEPFFGEDPHLEKLLAGGGENIYVTPDMKDWLRVCDDWIEALPAYASYQIIPEDGSYRVRALVQRSILEEMYRANADSWADNIREVMRTEHIALAREALAALPRMRPGERRGATACAAALIEKTYEHLAVDIGRLCEKNGSLRYECLRGLLQREESERNLVWQFRKSLAPGRPVFGQLTEFIAARGLAELAAEYQAIVDHPRRSLPSAHVLTTLGPGETEFNVKNWLEESMLLYNVIRRAGREDKVRAKMETWRKNLIQLGEKVIRENKLESEVYKLSPDERKKSEGILKALFAFPEAGEQAAALALLLRREGKDIHAAELAAREPECVLAQLAAGRPSDRPEEEEVRRLQETRLRLIKDYGLEDELAGYLKNYLNPTFARINARKEVIIEDGLWKELDNPLLRYEASGAYKKYNLLYTPSRVDLGAQEVHSVRDIPKWVGGIDEYSALTGRDLYRLYNIAGPTAVPSTRLAEFMKVGENFFSRGGPYYLSLTAGINLDALKIGDFEFFRSQWNRRGDRTVLPSGETYGGFCVPKEFSLLYAVISACVDREVSSRILSSFGIPHKIQEAVQADLREVLSWRPECASELDWEDRAAAHLHRRYPEYFRRLGGPACLARLPQIGRTLERMGILTSGDEKARDLEYRFTSWVNKKAQGLEEINRTGPFRKVKLIYRLVEEARRKNPRVAADDDLIGVMTANYKEGELEDGRLTPVSDVRFSAGSRKLEIYAKMADGHLLLDLDPEGRRIVGDMFEHFVPPADIRIVGRCTGSDILNHVPESGLEAVKNRVDDYLKDLGLDDTLIRTNAVIYGGNLKKWVGLRDRPKPEQERVRVDLEGKIHLLVTDKRGPFNSYRDAVQGVDFVDLGIPDPELLELIDNLPELLFLMKKSRPASALVLADGTSGARRPAFAFRQPNARRKAKELFGLDANASYGCLGIGRETIEGWRREMEVERALSESLLQAVLQGSRREVESTLADIRRNIAAFDKLETALNEEDQAKKLHLWTERDRFTADALYRLAGPNSLANLDFGDWLIFGGLYIVNGRYDARELAKLRLTFEARVRKLSGAKRDSSAEARVRKIIRYFFRPVFRPRAAGYREIKTGLAGSLKAAEEQTVRAARWEERKKESLKLIGRQERAAGFKAWRKTAAPRQSLPDLYAHAKDILGPGDRDISNEKQGAFLAAAREYAECLNRTLAEGGRGMPSAIDRVFSGGDIAEEDYLTLVTRLASAAELNPGDRSFYEDIGRALELSDIALLLDRTGGCFTPDEYNSACAKFLDRTVNSHIFDYLPYHYHKERSAALEKLSRTEKFAMAGRFHRWLYTRLRWLIANRTRLSDQPAEYRDLYLGDQDRDITAIGVRGETKEEIFWFHYARLRDAVALQYEQFGHPEVFVGLDPKDLSAEGRTNIGIIYPYGNTTVPVALEQGPKLAEERGINLILCAFPVPAEHRGRKILTIREGLFYPRSSDLAAIRKKRRPAGGPGSGLVLASFQSPLVLHGLFFHFTHPLRPEIDSYGIPIIQPLIWEAATHLKCELPAMLRGSGVKVPDQENWYLEDTARLGPRAKSDIRDRIRRLAAKHGTLIVKPEKESGGRKSLMLPVRDKGRLISGNIDSLAGLAYEISQNDNAVIQEVLPSRVRQLYSEEFLDSLVERFARIGIPVLLDRDPLTPLYSYFRQVLVLGKDGYVVSHHITVVSTQGIANVGQGGLLYEYTDDIIRPRYREDMRHQITRAARESLRFQTAYLEKNWRKVLEIYLKIHPEFAGRARYRKVFRDLTGFPSNGIPYEMGDYMPVFLVDEHDNLVQIFDPETERLLPLYDDRGRPTRVKLFDETGQEIPRRDNRGRPLPIPLFDAQGTKRRLFDGQKNPVPALIVYKIEANPGAGLWRPHNDRLPPERKGEGVFTIFDCLGQRGRLYKEKLSV